MIYAKGQQAHSRASVRRGVRRPGTAQAALISGAKTVAPFLVGIIPFGTITGVTLVGNGFPPLPAAGQSKRWFFLGCALPVWLIWQASTLAGVVLGMQMPQSWSLDFVIPRMFLSLRRLQQKRNHGENEANIF